ncbi:MAG: DUF6364 family protein [Bacteroidales bacterium]|jgi:hypothetical protein|nr:DUF6364 family protein [Bacteroidales bacterium]
MDAKITLSFNKTVIEQAKAYAASQNISLSRLMEFLLHKITSGEYQSIDEYPISDWVNELAEGKAEYLARPRSRISSKDEYLSSRK